MITSTYFKILKSTSEYDPTYFTFRKYVFVFVQLYTENMFLCTYLDVLTLAYNFSKVRKYVFNKYVVFQKTNMLFINMSEQKANTPIFDYEQCNQTALRGREIDT